MLKLSEVEPQESKLNTYKTLPMLALHKESCGPGDEPIELNRHAESFRQSENQLYKAQEAIRISSENPHLRSGLDRLKGLEMQSQLPNVQIVDEVGADQVDRKMVQSNIVVGFRDDKKRAEKVQKKPVKKKREEALPSSH